MAGKSSIEWTEHTWNPIVGCSIVSPGCTNCYAMKMAARLQAMAETGRQVLHYAGTTKKVNDNVVWTGKIAQAPERILIEPLKRHAPTTYFVNSMGDLFHESIPDEWINRVFAIMALCPQHTFQVLTKRAERMLGYVARLYKTTAWIFTAGQMVDDGLVPPGLCIQIKEPLPNVWLGVSCERQQEADERIPLLLQTPAAVRFISAEPLLGPVDLNAAALATRLKLASLWPPPSIDWVIVGGESGPHARPMSIQWVRELRDQCAAAGTSFFFKQWGEWVPAGSVRSGEPGRYAFGDYEHDRAAMMQVDGYPRQFTKFGARSTLKRVGKKAAGRLLDGREHNEFPGAARSAGTLTEQVGPTRNPLS